MELQDLMEPEVGIAVVVTAAIASPEVRKVVRRGAVYGLAGLLMAGDAVKSFTRGVGRGVQQAATAVTDEPSTIADEAQEAARPEPAGENHGTTAAADEPAQRTRRRPAGKAAETESDA